ncbi:MAG: hypothetical protein WED10_14495 [Brumimicrobium sp.]
MRKLLFVLVLGASNLLLAQNYSYSFTGETDSIKVDNIAKQLTNLEGVEAVKGRYKPEKNAGEFLIYTTNFKDKTNPYPFKPTKIKAVLIENDLSPIRFKELTTK